MTQAVDHEQAEPANCEALKALMLLPDVLL